LAGQRYQVKLATQSDKEVVITLMGPEGSAIPRRDQQALLTVIKGNVS